MPVTGAIPGPSAHPPAGPSATGGGSTRPGGGERVQRGLLVLAVAASVLALLASTGAAVVAWRALDQARDAKAIALGTGGAPADSATVSPTPAADESPDPTGGADLSPLPDANPSDPPPLNEQTEYTLNYEKQNITLRAAGGVTQMHADLEEPRADAPEAKADITLRANYDGQVSLHLASGVQGSQATEPALTPHDCSERIRTAPLGAEAQVPVRQGVVLCLWTSFAAAVAVGSPQLVVLLEVTGVAADGGVTLLITSWEIPR